MAMVRTTRDYEDLLLSLLPSAFCSSREDWLLKIIAPHVVRSLEVVGDVCLVGSNPQRLALPLAFTVAALGIPKTVYAFDYFDQALSAESDDPDELDRWSAVLPVRSIKGDAVQTCKLLIDRISLVLFDVGSPQTIEAVLNTWWTLMSTNTAIGINGLGYPSRRELKAFADCLVGQGRATVLSPRLEEDNGIRFLRPTGP
jgi:hypothetical protein